MNIYLTVLVRTTRMSVMKVSAYIGKKKKTRMSVMRVSTYVGKKNTNECH